MSVTSVIASVELQRELLERTAVVRAMHSTCSFSSWSAATHVWGHDITPDTNLLPPISIHRGTLLSPERTKETGGRTAQVDRSRLALNVQSHHRWPSALTGFVDGERLHQMSEVNPLRFG